MGRRKSKQNAHLPPRMSARPMKSGTVHYYYRPTSGGAIALGTDLAEAKVKWAQLEHAGQISTANDFAGISSRYRAEALPKLAPKTQYDYIASLARLDKAFGHFPLGQIKPHHVRQYLDKRSAKVSANREIAVFSALFNWAREKGLTDAPNPAAGVRRNPSKPREMYVTDDAFQAVWDAAPAELQDALDLARLTGQREADILKMRRDDIKDGHLWVRQNKTGARVGIEISGELATIIDRIISRPKSATGMHLVQTETGQRMTYHMLRKRFDAARKASGQEWQFRDLRPKAATDIDDVRAAQELLGHKSESTTAGIYRRSRGLKVKPVR